LLADGESSANLDILSHRQREILELVVGGFTNAQIAKRLFFSESTVKQHLRAAYQLLGVSNRTEAAKLVRRSGASRSGLHRPQLRQRRVTRSPGARSPTGGGDDPADKTACSTDAWCSLPRVHALRRLLDQHIDDVLEPSGPLIRLALPARAVAAFQGLVYERGDLLPIPALLERRA
jgi:DNA-binding CsgD family transcriptional regulator